MNSILLTKQGPSRSFKLSRGWRAGLALAIAVSVVTPLLADETVTTSNGTYVLKDPSTLLGQSALKSAERTAELAMSAAAQDASKLDAQQTQLDQDTKAYNDNLAAAKAAVDAGWASYKSALDQYNVSLNSYNAELSPYSAEVAQQRAEVAQSNALAATQRSQANVDRLNAWKAQLDSRKAALDGEKSNLDSRKAVLDAQRAANIEAGDKMKADFTPQYEELNRRRSELKFKQGEAYRQLQLCHNYALQINKILADKYHVANSTSTPAMTSAEEQLKALSNKGFDGTTDKSQLQNNGTGTNFFSQPKR